MGFPSPFRTKPTIPVGAGGGLLAANNLSDVASAATSRTNIGAIAEIVEDTTPQLGGDLDAQGYYALGLQNIPDLAARGPGYWFDGVNDFIEINSMVISKNGNYTLLFRFKTNTISKTRQALIGNTGVYAFRYIGINVSRVTAESDVNEDYWLQTEPNIVEVGVNYDLIIDVNNGTVTSYLNNVQIDQRTPSSDLTILYIGGGNYFSGEISKVLILTTNLSESERKALSSGAPVLYKYLGASQTALTSGTLIVGKQYIIDTFVAGDDFVNVGGTNVTGNTFVAIDTTPTTWTNSSSLRQIGCVLQLEQDGIGHTQWLDNSGNELHGAVSGCIPTNLPADDVERFRHTVAMTNDTTWTSVVPAGYELEKIVFVNSTANAATLDLGTTATGQDVFEQQVIAASGITTVVINKTFSMTAAQSLFLNDDGVGTWNSASLTATLLMRRVI